MAYLLTTTLENIMKNKNEQKQQCLDFNFNSTNWSCEV